MKQTVEARQARIERLFDRAAAEALEGPVNDSNTLYDFNVREVLKIDPYINQVWVCRTRIVRNDSVVRVPANTVDFFKAYAEGILSPSRIEVDENFAFEQPPYDGVIYRNTAVMYSGGSESVLMDAVFNYVELIRVHRFFPHSHISREFQLALIGMTLGYGTTNIGCALLVDPSNRREYEFSREFLESWNSTFFPYTIQYPLSWQEKDATYKFLFKNNFSFIVCDQPKNGLECGRCWHCAERYFYTMALRTQAGFEAVPQINMSLDFLRKVQRDNRVSLRAGDKDPYAIMTGSLKLLEQRYGVTAWYKGDPTQPFENEATGPSS